MHPGGSISRRGFVVAAGGVTLAGGTRGATAYPVGLELFSVRSALAEDLEGTVTAVARMGYEVVEFFAPYFSWTPEFAKGVRTLMDDLGIRCLSTHNGTESFTPEGMPRAIELNRILGARYVVMATAGSVEGLDGWKRMADQLNSAAEQMSPADLRPGYHNHQTEFQPTDGVRPIDVIANNTGSEVVLQLDVGTCVEVGEDPVAWIEENPGRFASIHLKDYSREQGRGYLALFDEGVAPWTEIFRAAEAVGGVEYYVIEQEGSDLPELESARRCLENYRRVRGGL